MSSKELREEDFKLSCAVAVAFEQSKSDYSFVNSRSEFGGNDEGTKARLKGGTQEEG